MRLDIRYRLRFHYAESVHESQNEVRMRPRDDDYQKVLFYRLISYPPVRILQAFDYWGTAVDHLGVRAPHTEFELMAEATVETSPRPDPTEPTPVEALEDPDFLSEHHEFLVPSRHVQWRPGDDVSELAAASVRGTASVTEMITRVVAETRRSLSYKRGSTEIGVSLADLLAGGSGVCQDFAHLAIGMLRSVGVPTRYVSGYLFAADETIRADLPQSTEGATDAYATDTTEFVTGDQVVSVQTHAWIAAAVPGSGWWMLDPANGGTAGERHVIVGCGRDYGDVPPVRGAFMGPATADVDAEVVIGRRDVGATRDSGERSRLHELPHIVVQPRTAAMRPVAMRRRRRIATP